MFAGFLSCAKIPKYPVVLVKDDIFNSLGRLHLCRTTRSLQSQRYVLVVVEWPYREDAARVVFSVRQTKPFALS